MRKDEGLMSKRKQSRDEEIWSKRFGEDYDHLEYVSRSEKSKNKKYDNNGGMSPLLTGTVIFLAILILAIIFYYMWFSNRPVDQLSAQEDAVVKIVKNEEEIASENDGETEEEGEETDTDPQSETASEVEAEQEEETELTPELEPEPEPIQPEPEPETIPQPTQPEQETESELSQPATSGTYTVQAGDNMYRIALNHGMTTAELMALNNLAEETLFIGQVLVVE